MDEFQKYNKKLEEVNNIKNDLDEIEGEEEPKPKKERKLKFNEIFVLTKEERKKYLKKK